MKTLRFLFVLFALAFLVSCEKPPSEAEKNAQIEKEVQARLAAERQADEAQRLAQQKADLEAREKALADKETSVAPTATATPRTTTTSSVSSASSSSEDSEGSQSYETFYRKLEPYGAWRETDDYGFVWQPREAQSRSWRPYTNGRWAYTDAGWTWVSEEPFGWAVFHYGRWTRLTGVGWVWVPGDEWAPAWVSWRTGAQNVGWAPLPPEAHFDHNKGIHKWADNYYDIDAGEYVFVPNEDIGAENIQRSVIPAERNVTIVSETTNVTNITYSNTIIVNQGPDYDELRRRSRRPVDRLRLQRDYDVDREETPNARISGETLRIQTPRFNARATAAPRTNGPRIERTSVDRSNAGGDQGQIERARQKMRSEATPPPDAPSKKFVRPAAATSTAAPVAATATPLPAATPAATAAPIATATPVATIAATATPLPRGTASARPAFTPRSTPVVTATPVATPVSTPIATPSATVARTILAPVATPAPPAEPTPAQPEGADPAAVKAQQAERKREEMREKVRRQLGATPTPGVQATPPPVPPRQNRATPPPPPAAEASPAAETSPTVKAPNALMRERARRVLQPGVKPSPTADPQTPATPNEP